LLRSLYVLALLISLEANAKYSLAAEVIEVLFKGMAYTGRYQSENYVLKLKEQEMDKYSKVKVKVTYNLDVVESCKSLGTIQLSKKLQGKRKLSVPFHCEAQYRLLTVETKRMGGNTTLINSLGNDCKISSYNAVAYLCGK